MAAPTKRATNHLKDPLALDRRPCSCSCNSIWARMWKTYAALLQAVRKRSEHLWRWLFTLGWQYRYLYRALNTINPLYNPLLSLVVQCAWLWSSIEVANNVSPRYVSGLSVWDLKQGRMKTAHVRTSQQKDQEAYMDLGLVLMSFYKARNHYIETSFPSSAPLDLFASPRHLCKLLKGTFILRSLMWNIMVL